MKQHLLFLVFVQELHNGQSLGGAEDHLARFSDKYHKKRCGTNCTHHNGIYNIILVIFKGFDGFCSRHVRLGHDQFDILGFYSRFVALK